MKIQITQGVEKRLKDARVRRVVAERFVATKDSGYLRIAGDPDYNFFILKIKKLS
jgi:hypothetical protein